MLPEPSMTENSPAPKTEGEAGGEAVGSLINDTARTAAFAQEMARWRHETENDAELGGPHLGASVARARSALQQFDPDQRVAQWLDQTGLGNHVEVLRFFNRIACAFGNDTVAVGRPAASGLSLEERMYPNWKP